MIASNVMSIRAIPFRALTGDEIAAWSAIQQSNAALASPYFRPEFAQCVATVRNDVEIAVLESGDTPVGFFPYQRNRGNVGRPLAGKLSDFQAIIAPANHLCDPLAVLQACKLSAWHFDHLLVHQNEFSPFVWRDTDSPYIRLGTGLSDYLSGRENGRSLRSEYGQRKRKIEREIGPLRFEADTRDPAVIAACFRWKEQQYLRTGKPNLFAYQWVRDLFDTILVTQTDSFSPMVSVLYVGSEIASVNFCLRSCDVLHAWFPAYNTELAAYSPGTLHWFEMIDALPSAGIGRIDLGKGPESFKRRFMSGAVRVAEGTVDAGRLSTMARRAWQRTRDWIRASWLYEPAKKPAEILYRLRSRQQYH